MHTSIRNRISIVFFIFFIISPILFGQEHVWEHIDTPEGINTPLDEFNFIPFDKQFMFTRIVSGNPKQFLVNDNAPITPFIWKQSALQGLNITYPMKYESTLYFSSNYQTLERSYLGIFELRNNNVVTPLAQTKPGSFASHPWITSDGQTLFFSSDREGSLGGADLWYYSKSPKGDWIGPFSMGDYINSYGNEINPFSPHPDTLYYATDGHGGKGGFEILMSVKERGEWLEPIPINEVNSEWNDMEFVILNDTLATYTSDKPGGKGNLDVYMLKKSIQKNTGLAYLAMTANSKMIDQNISITDNALAFRTFIFPRNNNLSSDDQVMLEKLSSELLNNSGAKVHVTMHPLIDKVIDILHKGNVPDAQISIDSTILESMMLISMDSKEMYITHPYVSSKCDPQSFMLYISSIPENLMSNWEITYNGTTQKIGIYLPDSLQFKTSFNIAPFQDSIVFHAKGINVIGMDKRDSLIIPIQRHIVNQSETIDTNTIPVLWHMKEIKSALPHFFRYVKSFTKHQQGKAEQEQLAQTKKNIVLLVGDFNAKAVDKTLQSLNNEPELREFTISKAELAQNNPLAKIIKLSITRAPEDEREYVIPILIQ